MDGCVETPHLVSQLRDRYPKICFTWNNFKLTADSDDIHLYLETSGLSPDQALDTVDAVIDLALRRPKCLFFRQVSRI